MILVRSGTNITGRVAQWITRLTTDQKIPGSNPGVVAIPILEISPVIVRLIIDAITIFWLQIGFFECT